MVDLSFHSVAILLRPHYFVLSALDSGELKCFEVSIGFKMLPVGTATGIFLWLYMYVDCIC